MTLPCYKELPFTTLTALLRSEFSSSACLPKELGGRPREFWRRSIGGVPEPRCSQSGWTSALRGGGGGGGGETDQSLSDRQKKKKEEEKNSLALQFLVHKYGPFEEVNVTSGSRGQQCGHSLPHLPSSPSPPLPGRSDQRLHLFYEVTADHVLVAGDPQRAGHGFGVEGGVEDHDGPVYAAIQEVFSKLLQVGDWGKEG